MRTIPVRINSFIRLCQPIFAVNRFRNYGARQAFGGPAVTIKCFEDNSLVKACVGEPGAGRVIVVDGGGSLRRALLGDMLAEEAATNGWQGLVIVGAVRDVDEIAATDLGVKALGQCPLKTQKRGTTAAGSWPPGEMTRKPGCG